MCSSMNIRRFCEEWRIWIRPLLIVTYAIFAIIVVPLLIVNSVKDGFKRDDQLILIGGLFVLSAVPVSLWHIIQHVIHFTKPILQKHIIRILWMVPIYAVNAWLGLLLPDYSIYVDSLRECYEAYVIYNFMVYLLNYLNLGMDLEATMEYKPQVHHIFPLCCLRPWTMGREFIHNCKHGILQYTVVRPITTFISVICELCGVYGEGTFAGNVAFPYIVVVNNISQFVAMYCLVLFYRANKEDLKPMKPIPKFLCIKAVVFFSFFQGVLLNILVYYNIIGHIFGTSGDTNLASRLQNFLICIEMFLAAVAHIYSFPHYPFHINAPLYWSNSNRNWFRAFLSMIDMSDVQEDVTEHLGVVTSSISRHFQGRGTYQPLSRGTRRTSAESDYLINKRQDSLPLTVAVDLSPTANNSNTLLKTPTTTIATNTGNKRQSVHENNSNNYYSNSTINVKNNIRKISPISNTNAKRYGATDNRLVLPIYENHSNFDKVVKSNSNKSLYPPHKLHQHHDPYLHDHPTTSHNIPTTGNKSEPNYDYYSAGKANNDQAKKIQQHEEQSLHVPSSAASNNISIQQKKRDRETALNDLDVDSIFAPQYLATLGGGAADGNSYLQTRHAINDAVDEDLATLLGGNNNRR